MIVWKATHIAKADEDIKGPSTTYHETQSGALKSKKTSGAKKVEVSKISIAGRKDAAKALNSAVAL